MSKTIKFTHGLDGVMHMPEGDTSLSYLFAFGAVSLTAKGSFDSSGNAQQKFSTDKEGLKQLTEMTEETMRFLSASIQTLGVVLVHCDKDEIREELDSLGWLINGLSSLMTQVQYENTELRCALGALSENTEK